MPFSDAPLFSAPLFSAPLFAAPFSAASLFRYRSSPRDYPQHHSLLHHYSPHYFPQHHCPKIILRRLNHPHYFPAVDLKSWPGRLLKPRFFPAFLSDFAKRRRRSAVQLQKAPALAHSSPRPEIHSPLPQASPSRVQLLYRLFYRQRRLSV